MHYTRYICLVIKAGKLILFGLIYYVSSSFILSDQININFLEQQITSEVSDTTKYPIYRSTQLTIESGADYNIDLNQECTSIRLSSILDAEIRITVNGESYTIGALVSVPDEEIPTNFIIFATPARHITLSSSKRINLTLELFYAKPIQLARSTQKLKKSGCDQPFTFDSDSWREGLPEPTPGREFTQVNHCVIHHAASSNSDTDYVNTVRNIYLLHTQSNGWDDIGYNYLIAQNGDVFEGRHHENKGDPDNVKGAHFCFKNEGTMGICLLGNYMTISPTAASISSLKQLLTWKLLKENLVANDSFIHPKNTGDFLGSIAYHQHGCATSCPGDSMLPLLQSIRSSVQQKLDSCYQVVRVSNKKIDPVIHRLYPNPNDGRFYCMLDQQVANPQIRIFNRLGEEVFVGKIEINGYVNSKLTTGVYFYQVWSEDKLLIRGKLQVNK